MRPLLIALLLLVPAAPGRAVLNDNMANDSANLTPPPDDPGMDHVGNKQGLTVVYIGKRWVATASHVPPGPVVLGGVTYIPVDGTWTVLEPVGAATLPPDLAMFRIWPEPPLPALAIRQEPITDGLPVTLIGNGADPIAEVTWNDSGTLRDGYSFGGAHRIRWGDNVTLDIGNDSKALQVGFTQTDSIITTFTQGVGPDECQVVNGDSGGAVFAKNSQLDWELAGIIFARAPWPGQPSDYALYGNWSISADLRSYRDQILAIRDAPEIPALPPWGPPLLAVLLAGLARGTLRRQSGAPPAVSENG
jgi:hypothetical protein